MVQSTTIQKTARRFKFLDSLSGSRGDRSELRKDVDFLEQDYVAFMNLAGSLSSHSKWIPYTFMIERAKKIAEELRDFAYIFRMKIIELDGQIPLDASMSSMTHDDSDNLVSGSRSPKGYDLLKQNIKRLVKDMEEHSSCCEVLHHQRNLIADASLAKLIDLIIVEMQRQKDELLDIVMKIS
jgi:hypothetical protein